MFLQCPGCVEKQRLKLEQESSDPHLATKSQEGQSRNLNPTPEAKVAMIIWGHEYSHFPGGSMDFWDSLPEDKKRRCELVIAMLSDPNAKE
jgi:hypothetical protein